MTTRYASTEKFILVCDNLNTHTMGSFYEAFPANDARELVRRIEFRYTPTSITLDILPMQEDDSIRKGLLAEFSLKYLLNFSDLRVAISQPIY